MPFDYAAPSPSQTPAVTIIAPAETEASLRGQSLQNWEWLGAEPTALSTARAPFVVLLEHDDRLQPTALEKLAWFLERHPQYCFARGYDSSKQRSSPALFRKKVLVELGVVLDENFWRRCEERKWWGGTIPEFLGSRADQDGQGKLARVWKNGIPSAGSLTDATAGLVNPLSKREGSKRLLLLVPHLELGGADKFNLDLIERLQNHHAYEVTVVATLSGTHPLRHEFAALTPDIFTLNTFLSVEDYPDFISSIIRSRRPDTVLIANCKLGYDLLPYLRTTSDGPSFLDYLHIEDLDPDGYAHRSLQYASYLDGTIVSSEHLKRWLIEQGRAAEQIEVCTTNIDPDLWDKSRYDAAQIRAKYGVPEGVPVIAYAARLCPQKQPKVLARVIQAVRDRGAEFVCLAAGDGEDRQWLESFVKANELKELRLLGALPNEQVREVLAISDIYFLPSEMEGIALALYEAMAMGVVPVSADVGGQSELVVPGCGILVKRSAGETEEYTRTLLELLNDENFRRSMARAARSRIVEHFTLDQMGRRMASFFEKAIRSATFDVEATRLTHPGRPLAPSSEKRRIGMRGSVATLFLLFSPWNFKLKMRNLCLLGRVISDDRKRAKLADLFDSRYYASHNPDVTRRAIAPLVHYAVQGYLENRQPSPHFDAAEIMRHDSQLIISRLNPMLWSILHAQVR
ncbi:MAG: glycosyltransferase [Bryobacterales bacterium]|nr:glycosyltransferase [Bryobacterales bacterium]